MKIRFITNGYVLTNTKPKGRCISINSLYYSYIVDKSMDVIEVYRDRRYLKKIYKKSNMYYEKYGIIKFNGLNISKTNKKLASYGNAAYFRKDIII